jgi:hypothetical protein
MLTIIVAVILAVAILVPMRTAYASNVTSSTGGPVSVDFVFASADFINTMSITSPVNRVLFNTRQSRIGTRVDLGTFSSGTTFRFRMQAQTSSGNFTWSSDPAQNSDGEDHLRVTELYDGDPTLDNRVYKLEWEDDNNLGDRDFNDAVAILRIGADSDGDGLFDDWERFGIDANNDGDFNDPGERDLPNGIDQNGNGNTNDPGERADPRHKDAFVEMDWMDCATAGGDCAAGDGHSHRPQLASINALVPAFRNAPVTNPDGNNGINLHVDVSNAVPHQNVLNFNGGAQGCGSTVAGTQFGDFDTVKAANFNNQDARRYAFHYALAIHMENQAALTDSGQRFSGCGEIGGNDFYISFGGWGAGVPTTQQEAGTIMHELGHNLGLLHGGDENVNFKPNYLSLMSYFFQLRGIPAANRLDYSQGALPQLNENSLNENLGIQDGSDNTLYFCPGGAQSQVPGTGAIDWNCNGTIQPAAVSANINGDGNLSTLTGFDDWPKVVQSLPFQTNGDFQDGAHDFTVPVEELDLQMARDEQLLSSPPELAPVSDRSGQYSDPITPYTLSATDTDSACGDLNFSATGLPSGLSVTDNGDCTATVSGVLSAEAGSYSVTYTVTDEFGSSDSATGTFTVAKEDAVVRPSVSNPDSVRVATAGGTSGPFTLAAEVFEGSSDASKGDISLATPVTYTLSPIEAGTNYNCTADTSGGGVGGVLQTSCEFSDVAVNVYEVSITVGGSHYQGSGEDLVAVYDPSLGFVTGGASVLHAGNQARAQFTARYLANGRLQGSIRYVEQQSPRDLVLTSDSLGALVIIGPKAYVLGTATLNGVANYSFRLTLVDNGEPGTRDRVGLEVRDPSGDIVPNLTFAPIPLTGGNVQVHR